MNSKNKTKAFVFLGVAFVLLITLTDCKQTSGGGKQGAPFVEGGASLILSSDKLKIEVRATTEDGSDIQVEGCKETTLKSDVPRSLYVTGTVVILKGKITKLYCERTFGSRQPLTALNVQGLTALQELNCWNSQLTELNVRGLTALQELNCGWNQLTSLNVQGCTSLIVLCCCANQLPELNVQGLTSLDRLWCWGNQLNAQAMTKLLNALPTRKASDDAKADLYSEETDVTEGNCKDFTQPEDLKKALEGAKSRNWKLRKRNEVDI